MKIIRSGLSNILVLAIFVGFAVLLVACFGNANSNSTAPYIKPLAPPSAPLARIENPVLLGSVDRLGPLNNGPNRFVTIVGGGSVARTIVLDPTTNTAQTITSTALWDAHIAGEWLVYVDHSAPNAADYYMRIKVLNLESGQEIILGDEHSIQNNPTISDNIVVWSESQDGKLSGIYGYDLVAGKKFPIVVKSGSRGYPRISEQWVTYVQWPGQTKTDWEPAIELHAYSLKTNEDILLGLIPSPRNAGWGTQYALDEDKIVWNKYLGNQSELHLYDLTTRIDRTLFGPANGVAYDLSISARSGVIVSPGKVIDWRQPEPVSLSFELPPLQPGASHDSFFVFGDHLFWRVGRGSDVEFFAAPVSR